MDSVVWYDSYDSIGCRICDRDRGRCGDPCKCSAVEIVCGIDLDIDFW